MCVVLVHVCTCGHVCVGPIVCVWLCMWRPKVDVRALPTSFLVLFIEAGSPNQTQNLPMWLVLLFRLLWGSSVSVL